MIMSESVKFRRTIRRDSHGSYIRIPKKLSKKHNLIDGVIVEITMVKKGGRERTERKTENGTILVYG